MSSFVLGFKELHKTQLLLVGGKGLNLGELSRIEGMQVPEGFCVTTVAYQQAIEQNETLQALLNQLSLLNVEDREKIAKISGGIRQIILEMELPFGFVNEVAHHLSQFADEQAYAVRSSATAEDLPHASFAGQYDTFLNIVGKGAILQHISKCWASLFTDRAVIYRMQNGFDHSHVWLSVIVQRMVFPQASGVIFTADPITSNRKSLSIDAVYGLGEALVSGLVASDSYKVQAEKIVAKRVATKKLAMYGRKGGGTETRQTNQDRQNSQTLTDEQILQSARIARQIEAHFGCPQDIEWCLVDETFYIIQSRPITTLYPIPEANDQENHVYVSGGHQQMMTDPMKPLGISLFLLTTNAPMRKAGGRLFVDCTRLLASPDSRESLLNVMGQHDPLIKDALMMVVQREGFINSLPDDNKVPPSLSTSTAEMLLEVESDPTIVAVLIKRSQTSIEKLRKNIQAKSGVELIGFILEDIQELKRILFDPQSSAVIRIAMNASSWINEKMNMWLGEKNVADTLSLSVPNNITAEMGLALLDVADMIRPYPEVISYLQQTKDNSFLDELAKFDGGQGIQDAIYAYLDKYGMRCSGEIDITKPRWSERPILLVPMILNHIKELEAGAGNLKLDRGRQEALNKEEELLDKLQELPDGQRKAQETKHIISLIRNFMGYREYPKYGMIHRYFVYKLALLKEAEQLVQASIIREREDIFYLTFEELQEVLRTHKLDNQIISQRKKEYKFYERLSPPRVITSDGEIIGGEYNRGNLPPDAIVGLPVSSGVVEGRARVICKMEDAELEAGDILVTSYTDPGWTPLFVSIVGLVTEVGGLMTHGTVIAREYGLPAVVGVEHATKLIKDGQRIRVNGTEGYIELL